MNYDGLIGMSRQPIPHLPDRFAVIPYSLAAIVVATGSLILVSWQLGIERMQGFVPGFPRMNPLTAVDFISSGLALLCILPELNTPVRRSLGHIFAAFAGVTALLMLVGILCGWNPGVDEILFHSRVSPVGHAAARMAPGTAVDFILISSSLLLLDFETSRGSRPAQFLAFVAGAIAVIDVTGYAYGGQPFIGFRVYRSMALPTALSFLFLSVGILVSRSKSGFVAVCLGNGAGAIVVRRLLPLAVTAPIALGWLRIWGQRAGWFSAEAGIAFTSAAYIIVLATIVLWTAQALQQLDNQREAVQENLRKSEERYRRRSAELEAANKELEAFSYSVSHDLRAPLRGIDGFSRILLADYGEQVGAAGKDYIARICAAARRMSELIDDLLKLSRVARTEIRRELVDVSELARAIADDLRAGQPERDVEFAITGGLQADADPGLMRVVVENLIGNAWKFTAKRQRGRIEFGESEIDGTSALYIRDNGAGFDQSHAGQLFGAFQRLHRPTEFPGTGIGLATVQRIIHRHGGEIWGEGAVDEGAAFYFTMCANGNFPRELRSRHEPASTKGPASPDCRAVSSICEK